MAEVVVRPYEPRDRTAVRRICCDTADRGSPVEKFFRDRETFADVVTSYYTDDEPEAVWIAESQGEVIGYLTGCLDERRYHRLMRWRIIPKSFIQAFAHGDLLHPETWRLLKAAWVTWRKEGLRRWMPLEEYPAHMHINLSAAFRGHHVGHQLVDKFSAQVKEAGLKGIHLVTRSDNVLACQFFEGMGFIRLDQRSVAMPDGVGFRFHDALLYGKKL